jgi:hypothetical protein
MSVTLLSRGVAFLTGQSIPRVSRMAFTGAFRKRGELWRGVTGLSLVKQANRLHPTTLFMSGPARLKAPESERVAEQECLVGEEGCQSEDAEGGPGGSIASP